MEISPDDDYYSWLVLTSIPSEPQLLHIIIGILAIFVLLFLSAMISGSEVAFFSLTRNDLKNIKSKTDRSSNVIIDLLASPKELLATILIANNIINVAIVIISYYIIASFINVHMYPILGFVLEIIVVTFIIVLFGEVIPKVFANYNNVKLAYLTVYPLAGIKKFVKPLSKLLVDSTNIIERKLKRKSEQNVSLEDISQAIDLSVDEKTSTQEINILKGIVKFGDIAVKQIMKARVDMKTIDDSISFREVLEMVRNSGFSRIPVFAENKDSIKGILYVKDLLKYLDEKENFDWHKLIRPPFFVPETKKIDDLLKEFQIKRIHMAIVVDEYGGTSGLITLEDIMEEIIGDIKDEFDEETELSYTKIDENTYIFEGKTLLNDIYKVAGIDPASFDGIKGDYDSLAGLVLELCGKIPEKKEEISHQNFLFIPLSVSKKRILKVKLVINEENRSLNEGQ